MVGIIGEIVGIMTGKVGIMTGKVGIMSGKVGISAPSTISVNISALFTKLSQVTFLLNHQNTLLAPIHRN
jgi:hypothetical protein